MGIVHCVGRPVVMPVVRGPPERALRGRQRTQHAAARMTHGGGHRRDQTFCKEAVPSHANRNCRRSGGLLGVKAS